jgi:biotin carboxylase
MQERIIILGAGVMQGPAIRIAKEMGLFTVVLDAARDAPCVSLADQFEQLDLKDKEGIEAFARLLQNSCGLGGLMTAGTDFSASVAWVAERLGLPGIPYEAALNASDKSRMRACFKKAALPSPEFITVTADSLPTPQSGTIAPPISDLRPLPIPFPVVVKPVDNMGGRGCRRLDCMAEYDEAVRDALRFSRSGRAIVEAFMDGPEFSVDAIVYHGEITICGLADRHIFFPPYFIEMGHTMPTLIEPEKQRAILETFCDGIRALGLAGEGSAGAAKGDIKLTASGPMIGEIAARLSGGYMSGWTYPYASGVQPIRAAILAALGRKPAGLEPLKNWTSEERAFISIPGTVMSISGLEAARNQPQVRELFRRIGEGSKLSFPENNVSKCGNLISSAPERAVAVEAAESAARSVLIRLDPKDLETEAFLKEGVGSEEWGMWIGDRGSGIGRDISKPSGLPTLTDDEQQPQSPVPSPQPLVSPHSPRFPPSAFQLSPELSTVLEKLPETTSPASQHHKAKKIKPRRTRSFTEYWYKNLLLRETPCNSVVKILKLMMLPLPVLSIYPFPEFCTSGLRDYVGRTVEESLGAVRALTGLPLPEIRLKNRRKSAESSDYKKRTILGKSFWVALVRGGYQGAAYYIDRLVMEGQEF